jgi:spermidine/putrescine ABC transporter ATP-binding subunit
VTEEACETLGGTAAMADVVLEKVGKAYGGTPAVRGIELHIAPGEFVTLLGASGCGKTTCLRMVAGFVRPDSGRIIIGGRDVTAVPPHRRDAGMVFQSYALFPHKTVAQNVAFGLSMRHVPRGEIKERTCQALQLVRLERLADRYPSELSGGQQQRVALARAVVIRPQVLLLDEPLGALDLKLREQLQAEIKQVQSILGITTLFVTHDQGEALGMSDRVAVMRDGQIVQVDTPHVLYERPNSEYVAKFVGRTNLVEVIVRGRAADGMYQVESESAPRSTFKVAGQQHLPFEAGERCLMAARPEHVCIGAGEGNIMEARVLDVTYRGSTWNVELCGSRNEQLSAVLRSGDAIPQKGEPVSLTWAPSRCFLLKSESSDILQRATS